MKYGWTLGLALLAGACAPLRQESFNPLMERDIKPVPLVESTAPPPDGVVGRAVDGVMMEHPLEKLRATRTEVSGIVFEGVAFDARSHRLALVDQTAGPGSEHPDAKSAAIARGGIAAVNAGFFTPEGDPLGWVIEDGKRTGNWNSASSLGSGLWHQGQDGRAAISRRETLGREGAAAMWDLLQAGPMLVENAHAVSGLESSKSSVRTVIAWDGGNRWWIGRTSPCTLASMALRLSQAGPAGWRVRHALNLDGGRSADLWVSGSVSGGPLLRRTAWNRPVRNFLVLVSR